MPDKLIDMRKIKKCPECRRYKTGSVCVCGHKWQEAKKAKPAACKGTPYLTAEPPMTEEERELSKQACCETMKKLVNTLPHIFAGKKWDKYRKPKPEPEEAHEDFLDNL